MRHGKAVWAEPGLKDFDRSLNERGMDDVPMMASRFAAQEALIHLIIASPAIRTKTTAMLFAYKVGYDTDLIIFNKKIYEAMVEGLHDIIKTIDNGLERVMMVGHNPALTHLVEFYTPRYLDNLPTSGIIKMEFEVTEWSQIKPSTGTLCWIDYPKNPSQ
jgi:phosphohistidine phosphatase